MDTRAGDPRILQEIVSTVASSLELDEVLRAVVRLLSEGSGVRACFAYLREPDPDRFVLRAASTPYEQQVGKVALVRGEGLAWWAAERREPAFIRERALDDPRTKYVPELEEERFQSLLAMPLLTRSGEVIGAITAHTEAPREFTDAEVDFLVASASLVGGAIENARLYEETRARVDELRQLAALAEAIAASAGLDGLARTIVADSRRLLRAASCQLYLVEGDGTSLALRAGDPRDGGAPAVIRLAELGPELARPQGRPARVSVPLLAGEELIGLLVAEGTSRIDLARMVASQAAVGIEKVRLIEHLTETNLIRDFFDQLASGAPAAGADAAAARLGVDLARPHLVLEARPPGTTLETAIRSLARGALVDSGDESVRALVPVPAGGPAAVLERMRRARPSDTAVGVSGPCAGEASFADGFREATDALRGGPLLQAGPGVVTFEELGPYRYLLRMADDGGVRDEMVDAITRLADYDAQRGASLLRTLEEYLRQHGSISRAAAALYVHPNTLRQRLRRIADLTGLDLRTADWLSLELAARVVRLQTALERSPRRAL
jgi:GAF domain-containing protein